MPSGSIDIDQGTTPNMFTALMIAADGGFLRIVKFLLNKSANAAIARTLVRHKTLLKPGSNLEAATSSKGCTPFRFAAEGGHSEVISLLIEAGADHLNIPTFRGATPLRVVAQSGHLP